MTNTPDAACAAANAPGLPDDTRRLIEIEDAIAKRLILRDRRPARYCTT
ncbi:hypothetical protein [Rhodovulum marinum]|uniref:Uncharacterized protein n=1 Tax=Rhodovulum marinum TaxID=320662 RepID=A0A4R2PT75_9RHOB|nr:hypothetical protein [Rhodovulum marinum]TCP39079.1 hypothetical protein EV662_1145 [Rhodovulum marinum]